jgi:hypothetical protein
MSMEFDTEGLHKMFSDEFIFYSYQSDAGLVYVKIKSNLLILSDADMTWSKMK